MRKGIEISNQSIPTSRNARCPCGSGLKLKHCREKGKCSADVTRSVLVDLGREVPIRGAQLSRDGRLRIIDALGREVEHASATIETHRDRVSGAQKPKILNSSPLGGPLVTDPDQALRRYKRLFAIDTSYRNLPGPKKICVTVALLAVPNFQLYPNYIKFGVSGIFEFRNVTCEPEKLGWKQSLQSILRSSDEISGPNLVLVDAHLRELKMMNDRQSPILDDFFLPKDFTLAYASTDTGQQFAINKLMRACDRETRHLLGRIECEDDLTNLRDIESPHASQFRAWVVD